MVNDVEPTMLGNVTSVHGSSLTVELVPQVMSGLIVIEGRTHRIGQVGSFVRIAQGYNELFGIITEASESVSDSSLQEPADSRLLKVELVGESIGEEFQRGISQYPSINDEVHIVTESDLLKIYGYDELKHVTIGRLSSSDSIRVGLDLNELVNKHSALVGSTGSGKSTSVASLLRSIVLNDEGDTKSPSARVVLFDLHGEYSSALNDIAQVYSVTPGGGENSLFVPYWCISPDSLIEFLCGKNEQLKNKFMDKMVESRKEFAAKHYPDIDQSKITPYSPIPFDIRKIWYDLYFEDTVTWNEKEHENPAISEEGSFSELQAPVFSPPAPSGNPPFKGGPHLYVRNLDQMRSRMLDEQYSFFLSPGPWTPMPNLEIESDLSQLIRDWLGKRSPITILDISGMPSSRLDLILGSMLDILFEASVWGRNLPEGMRSNPLLVVMEEAHRYLSSEINGVSKDMVKRIAKEGRKFGIGSMLVSQRPSEIDETILSQCGTFFALRVNNAADRSKIKSAMSDALSGMVDALPILRTGEAFITGEATQLPMRCKFRLPPEGRYPDSKDPKVSDQWSKEFTEHDFTRLVSAWRHQNANLDQNSGGNSG